MKEKLEANEKIIFECKTHWIALLLPAFLSIFTLIMFIPAFLSKENREDSFILLIMSILLFGIPYLRVRTNRLVLTDKRIYGKSGIIKTTSLTAPISKIQTVNIDKGILGRILGYSDLEIHCITGIYKFKKQSNAQEMQSAIINSIK